MPIREHLLKRISDWLRREKPEPRRALLCDFGRLSWELRPGDVLLVEGRSRISDVIKMITQSNWTHSALYLGRLHDIEDPELRERVRQFHDGDPSEQLIVEALLGEGTIVVPLAKYRSDHVRICRPKGLAPHDVPKVIGHAIRQLGKEYDIRHLLDLARFFFPWTILPRRWRSTIFEYRVGQSTRTVCSTLIAEAFQNVRFPILPFIDRHEDGRVRFVHRNPRLYTPKDFDYSPYFEIIKYPYLGIEDVGLYRHLPWSDEGMYNDEIEVPTGENAAGTLPGAAHAAPLGGKAPVSG